MEHIPFNNMFTEIFFMRNRQATSNFENEVENMLYHNLLYVYCGTGIFTYNNKAYEIPESSLIYYPPHCYQKISTLENKPLMYYSVNFSALTLHNDIEDTYKWSTSEVSFNYPFYKTFNNNYLQAEFLKKFNKLYRVFYTNKASDKNIFYEPFFLIDIIKLVDTALNLYLPPDKRKIIEPVISYITNHYNENLSLKILSDIAGVSNTYLNKLFKEYTNVSPINYLINVRLSKAKEFIEDGYSVSDAATLSGFNDVSYFSNMFKKKESLSPSDYKKLINMAHF